MTDSYSQRSIYSMSRPCDVLIYGGGAVGSILGWRIAQQAHTRVSVVCRSNHKAVKTSGFTFRTKAWGNGSLVPYQVFDAHSFAEDHAAQHYDYVICANKVNSKSFATVLRDLSYAVDIDTTLVCAQNGMDVELPLQQAFPYNTILSAICNIGCSQPHPGYITQSAGMNPKAFLIGVYGEAVTIVDQTRCGLLVACDARFGSIEDVSLHRWKKLMFNSVWNATSALTDLDTHEIFKRPVALQLARSIAREAYGIALQSGIELSVAYDETVIDLARSSGAIIPSTLQDARKGRHMEIDSIWGYLVLQANRCGIIVPTIQMVHDMLQHLNTSFTKEQAPTLRVQLSQIFDPPMQMEGWRNGKVNTMARYDKTVVV